MYVFFYFLSGDMINLKMVGNRNLNDKIKYFKQYLFYFLLLLYKSIKKYNNANL